MTIKRAGLCVLDFKTRHIFCLKRKRPYTRESNPNFFIEQFSIPRGKCERQSESLRDCATREFIEETECYFHKIEFCKDVFNLYWHDPTNVRWEYTMFFAYAAFSKSNIVQFSHLKKIPDGLPTVVVTIAPEISKPKRYEPVFPHVLKYDIYKTLVLDRLPLYGPNNYKGFLKKIEELL